MVLAGMIRAHARLSPVLLAVAVALAVAVVVGGPAASALAQPAEPTQSPDAGRPSDPARPGDSVPGADTPTAGDSGDSGGSGDAADDPAGDPTDGAAGDGPVDDGATTDGPAADAGDAADDGPAGGGDAADGGPATGDSAGDPADRDAAEGDSAEDDSAAGDHEKAGEPPHSGEEDAKAPVIPAGGGFVNSSSDEAGSYAFTVRKGAATYLVTARHVAPTGTVVYGQGGLLGATSLVSASRDTAYVRLTSGEPSDRVQIATTSSGRPVRAQVDGVASRGSIQPGQRVCHSGYAESTQEAGGFVCGTVVDVPEACESYRSDGYCSITMRSDDGEEIGYLGDSGGPVWQRVGPDRVRLLGVFTSVSAPHGGPPTLGHFVPAFDVLDDLGGVPVSATS